MSLNSSGVSGPGLAQHGVADADLADVVQEGAEPQNLELIVGQGHLPADADRHRADALRVAGGIRVPRVERQRQRADRADIGGLGRRFGADSPIASSC